MRSRSATCSAGVFKSSVYGVIIAISGCLRGFQCGNSSSAVGDAATSAVVTGIVLIVVACGSFALVFNILGILKRQWACSADTPGSTAIRMLGRSERRQLPHIVRNLTMAYGSFVVMRESNFTVRRGDVFVIMGGSGSGKSTLLRHMIGLLEPAAGEILYDGVQLYQGGRPRARADAAPVRRALPERAHCGAR